MGIWTITGTRAYLRIGETHSVVMGDGKHECLPSSIEEMNWMDTVRRFNAQWELYRASESIDQALEVMLISGRYKKAESNKWLTEIASGKSAAAVMHAETYLIFSLYLPDRQFDVAWDVFKNIVGGADIQYHFHIDFPGLSSSYDEWAAGQVCLLTGVRVDCIPAKLVK